MATVAQLTEPYANHLQPVLPAGPGVCAVCGTSVAAYATCWQCSEHRRGLPLRADAVAAVALAVKGEQLAYELAAYKSSPSPAARSQLRTQLAAVAWRWIAGHERCLAAAAGTGIAFDLVTVVPSSRGRVDHPLRDVAARMVVPTASRYADLLVLADAPMVAEQHAARGDMFGTINALAGQSVLVLDDTWTTGAHAQSAACALKVAGAGRIGVLALGRHFQTAQKSEHGVAARDYLARAGERGWSWDRCSRC